MVIIENSSKNLLNTLDLHDAEINDIKCNYREHLVELPIVLHSPKKMNVNAKLVFESVVYFDICIVEPWGEGIYINEVKFIDNYSAIDKYQEFIDDKHFNLVFILNSGDQIHIVSKKILYSEL